MNPTQTPNQPTPRTDAEESKINYGEQDYDRKETAAVFGFCRSLETELTTALARIAALEKDCLNNIEAHAKLSYQKNSEIDSLTRQLSESQAEAHFIRKQRDDYREDRNKANDYIERLGHILGSTCGDDTPEKLIRELQAELASAREDGARLDWIENEAGKRWIFGNQFEVKFTCTAEQQFAKRPDVRSAIDAARGVSGRTETPPSEAPVPASTWKPIETAPKDHGKHFLGFVKWAHAIEDCAIVCAYSQHYRRFVMVGESDAQCEITHWQALPPPPQGK